MKGESVCWVGRRCLWEGRDGKIEFSLKAGIECETVLFELWVLDFLEWILSGCSVLYWRLGSHLGRQGQ
jgi:hypothetical protein